jgi:hypothetical protein
MPSSLKLGLNHRHQSNIDCLSFVMYPLLAQLKASFLSFFAAAIYSTIEANKAGGTHAPLSSLYLLDVYGLN